MKNLILVMCTIVGFLLIVVGAGSLEFNSIGLVQFIGQSAIGLLMVWLSFRELSKTI